jgi:hypothetical protein
MLVHLYSNRKWNKFQFYITCRKEWIDGIPAQGLYRKKPVNCTTATLQVTCPLCLDYLIAKVEDSLIKLKTKREAINGKREQEVVS